MAGTGHTGGCRAARGALGAGGRMLWGRDSGREGQESAGGYLGQDPARPGRGRRGEAEGEGEAARERGMQRATAQVRTPA